MAYVAGESYVAGKGITAGQWAVLDVLRGIIKAYARSGRKYCFPSQETILQKLRDYHGVEIKRRTLCYWLKRLEAMKLIFRQRRLTRARFMSTAYYILDRGGNGIVKAKKKIGQAKRLALIFPRRAQKFAHDRHATQCQHSGGAADKAAAPASGETKRYEDAERRSSPDCEKTAEPAPSAEPEGRERIAALKLLDRLRENTRRRLHGAPEKPLSE